MSRISSSKPTSQSTHEKFSNNELFKSEKYNLWMRKKAYKQNKNKARYN